MSDDFGCEDGRCALVQSFVDEALDMVSVQFVHLFVFGYGEGNVSVVDILIRHLFVVAEGGGQCGPRWPGSAVYAMQAKVDDEKVFRRYPPHDWFHSRLRDQGVFLFLRMNHSTGDGMPKGLGGLKRGSVVDRRLLRTYHIRRRSRLAIRFVTSRTHEEDVAVPAVVGDGSDATAASGFVTYGAGTTGAAVEKAALPAKRTSLRGSEVGTMTIVGIVPYVVVFADEIGPKCVLRNGTTVSRRLKSRASLKFRNSAA